jgi:hypothetical protein
VERISTVVRREKTREERRGKEKEWYTRARDVSIKQIDIMRCP